MRLSYTQAVAAIQTRRRALAARNDRNRRLARQAAPEVVERVKQTSALSEQRVSTVQQ